MDKHIVVLDSPGFSAIDGPAPAMDVLHRLLPSATFVDVPALKTALADNATALLVLPYGSAFPEEAWPDIYAYLERGGNLLVIGGRPFTRAVFRVQSPPSHWQVRDYSVRFSRALMIDQYEETPGSADLKVSVNPDLVTQVAAFGWRRAFSPIIHLSAEDVYTRQGSAGRLDSRLDPLLWGMKEGRRLAVPAVQIDHIRSRFVGGRWIFLNAELGSDFYTSGEADRVLPALANAALRGSGEFTVRPDYPLYLPGETVQLQLAWVTAEERTTPLTVEVTIYPEDDPSQKTTKTVPVIDRAAVTFPAPAKQGLYVIDAKLRDGNIPLANYRSAFWMRDEQYLVSGPKLGVNRDYFLLDGKPLAVVGTTYMASDVQRLFFEYPNVYVWDRDLGQISDAGLNMLRTGWWTAWDKLCDESGEPYERTLRVLEAYLMTARKHALPVQLNFFAFLPEVLGGSNAYLDPAAIRRQKAFYAGVARRFHYVPFLAFDLINEPSNGQRLWTMRPNGDPLERATWNDWLRARYPDINALAHSWNVPLISGSIALPSTENWRDSALEHYDFNLFWQQQFANWAGQIRTAIRKAGAEQPITVGQDEGGYKDRLSPAFFGGAVDFTTNHSWWEFDNLLWDSLVAKLPGKPMLVQETGAGFGLTPQLLPRMTEQQHASLIGRKVALSFAQGTGVIQWLWNSNSFMTSDGEVSLGALRADGTERGEALVLRNVAAFAKQASAYLQAPEHPSVAIITSQVAQYSVMPNLQLLAQQRAVRAAAYYARISPYMVTENQIANMGTPKLAILPSPQALSEAAWQELLKYVNGGGNLLVTGPVDRDEHWQPVKRMAALKVDGSTAPLLSHTAEMRVGDENISMNFDAEAQQTLEFVAFVDHSGLREQALGNGRIYWAAYPLELAESDEPTGRLYRYILQKMGIASLYDVQPNLSPGILLYATPLQNAVLYVLSSEDANDAVIHLHDKTSGAKLEIPLPAQHAALLLLDRKKGSVIAKYGF